MDLYTLLFEFGQHLIMYLADNAGYGRVRQSISCMHVHRGLSFMAATSAEHVTSVERASQAMSPCRAPGQSLFMTPCIT